jgi:methylthioribose-1-phosphate isomerase
MDAAPTTTFDLTLESGEDIPIEQRPQEEVTSLFGQPIAPAGCQAINPSFDVTPAGLIDVIATEKGLIMQPDRDSVALLLAR